MTSLTDFLLARIAEDEAVAKSWGLVMQTWDAEHDEGEHVTTIGATVCRMNIGTGDHIARHDPARVLAECEAKRAIVELREYLDQEIRRVALSDHERATDMRSTRLGLDMAIRLLALGLRRP